MAATKQRPLVRALLTAGVILIGLGVTVAFYLASKPKARPLGASPPAVQAPAPPAEASPSNQEPAQTEPAQPAAAQPTAEPQDPVMPSAGPAPGALPEVAVGAEPATAGSFVARLFPASPLDALGSADPASPYKARIEFAEVGAGVESITLADYRESPNSTDRYAVQRRRDFIGPEGRRVAVASLATLGVEIDGQYVDLFSAEQGENRWRQVGPGAFEALIDTPGGEAVARVEKRFSLEPGSYQIRLHQRLVNLSGRPIKVRWYQYGPVDLQEDKSGYNIEVRRFRWGYLPSPSTDPSRQFVQADTKLLNRAAILKPEGRERVLWPTAEAPQRGHELVWLAMTSRYFAFAIHPLIDESAVVSSVPLDKRFDAVETAHRVLLGPPIPGGGTSPAAVVAVQLTAPLETVAPGGALDLSMGAYAGPMLRPILRAEPLRATLSLDKIIAYNLGGMCAPCTFPWLANILFWFLHIAHDYLVFDWAIAIMLLVLVVRAILHPITRRSQISIARFSKQMAALAPKQQALREKYKSDPKRMQQEMARLMKEEGVSLTGALGCVPVFLQTPVWIALYAMLFFAFELRHTPAFYGVFQWLTAGRWTFLADLSAPDRFIPLPSIHIPLVSSLMGEISGINLLPLLLGVVFYIQQKYLTPPPSTALTPEQETQQKIIKVMMVVLFPVMMYNAPSGLAIYFITNSTLGILESRWIRSHITALDIAAAQNPSLRKKSFLERIQDEAQRRAAQRGALQKPTAAYKKRQQK